MSYTKSFEESGWELSMDLVADQLVARLVRGSEVFELFTHDTTMLDLPDEGYKPTVTDGPWVLWRPEDGGEWYVWVCFKGVAKWANSIAV